MSIEKELQFEHEETMTRKEEKENAFTISSFKNQDNI